MADTLATIRSRVAFKAGSPTNINSRIDENINEAILQVIQEAHPQEMWANNSFTLTSGTASYLFSAMSTPVTDVLWVLFVRNTTEDRMLIHRSFEWYNRTLQNTSVSAQTGEPHCWTRRANGLLIYSQIPDSTSRTLKFEYIKRPTRLAADSDTFPLNDEWKRPVEELATAMTLMDLNAVDKAAAKMDMFRSLMDKLTPEGEEDASPDGSAFVPTSNLNLIS